MLKKDMRHKKAIVDMVKHWDVTEWKLGWKNEDIRHIEIGHHRH